MTLLEMSLTGAALVAAITAVRVFILHRLPKGTLLALWLLALARFLLPVSLPSPVSAYSLAASVVVSQSAAETLAAPMPPAPPDAPAGVGEAAPPVLPLPLLPLAWAAGSAGCALYFVVVSVRCRREFRMSLPLREPAVSGWLAAHPLRREVAVRVSDRVSAPLTFGILRPVILLPEGFGCSEAGQLDFVLTHEWVHIRRFDGMLKLLTAAAACLHWWNPAVWALYVLFNRDLELACDEAVVRRCGGRADYARALIRLEERKSGLAPFCSSFNQNPMEERILAIMKMKNMTRRTAAASAATVFAVAALFATSAAVGQSTAVTGDTPADGEGTTYWEPADQVDWDGERELLEGFKRFGITYDREGKMYFNGERVRWFWDGYEIWEDGSLLGWSMRYEYLDKDGTVDVRTIHTPIDNGDGSLDYYGPLTDIVAYSKEEFESRSYESLRENCRTVETEDAVLTEDTLYPGTGGNSMDALEDSTREQPAVYVIQEDAAGVTESTAVTTYTEDSTALSSVAEDTAESTVAVGGAAKGRTFAEIFAEYRDFGIAYREKDGIGEVFYNGEPVAHFADIQPGGSAFTFSPTGGTQSTLSVHTAYDTSGKLTGVVAVQ